jgi:ligand-binding sensor domain-containing protein
MAALKIRFLLLLSIISVCLQAQQYPVMRYQTNDGLGHPVVYRIFQDKKGLLWFSTDNGLTRYDGRQFRNYSGKDGFRSNFIFEILESDSGLLVSTFGGGIQKHNGIHVLPDSFYTREIPYPLSLYQQGENTWVIDRNTSLYLINKSGCKQINPNVRLKFFQKLIDTKEGLLAIGFGFYLYNKALGIMEQVNIKEKEFNETNIFNIISLTDNIFLFTTINGLYTLHLKDRSTRLVQTGNFGFSASNLLKAKDGTVWVAENNGRVWRYDKELLTRSLVFENVVVNHLMQDREGAIWLATYGQGAWRIPGTSLKRINATGLVYPHTYYSYIFQKPLVISSNFGVFFVDSTRLQTTSLYSKNIHAKNVYTAYAEHDQEYLLGTNSDIYRVKNGQEKSIRTSSCASLYRDRRGNYWAGMRTGLYRIDPDFEKKEAEPLFEKKNVLCITEDSSGKLYVGTNTGLYVLYKNSWQHFGKAQGLKDEYINHLLYDTARKLLWIGANEGLFFFNGKDEIKSRFNQIRFNRLITDRQGRIQRWVNVV